MPPIARRSSRRTVTRCEKTAPLVRLDQQPLANSGNRVALADHPLQEDRGIDTGHPAMSPGHMPENHGFRGARFGIDGDHLAARIALEDDNPQALADLKRASQQLVLPIRMIVGPVDVKIRPEAPAINGHAELLAETSRRGVPKDRDGTTVVQAAFAEPQLDCMLAAVSQLVSELRRLERQDAPVRRDNVDREGTIPRIQG